MCEPCTVHPSQFVCIKLELVKARITVLALVTGCSGFTAVVEANPIQLKSPRFKHQFLLVLLQDLFACILASGGECCWRGIIIEHVRVVSLEMVF